MIINKKEKMINAISEIILDMVKRKNEIIVLLNKSDISNYIKREITIE